VRFLDVNQEGGAQENEAFPDLGLCIAKLYFYFGRVAEFDCLFVRAENSIVELNNTVSGCIRLRCFYIY